MNTLEVSPAGGLRRDGNLTASCGICIAKRPWLGWLVRPKLLTTIAQRIGKRENKPPS
jgi:hypothetical protein